MSVIPFTGTKTVLIMTDDFLSIYTNIRGRMKLVDSLEWQDETFSAKLHKSLKIDCKSRPIIILNDMVEQHYRKERVIKGGVGVFDKSSMINRKLMAAFPNYGIRAALPLKEEKDKAGVGSYIFTALPSSAKVKSLINVLMQPEFTVEGLHLLPVEACDLVQTLSDKLQKRRKAKKAKWNIFMGQHRSGSLRQIVVKNGELALTRMTPIADMHEKPESWVLDAHQEFKATMSYLTRFGYEESDGLNVTVIADSECGQALETLVKEECFYSSMNVAQIASIMGIRIDNELSENYADILHVGWVAKKGKLTLPMQVAELDAVAKPRKVASFITLLLLCSAAFLGFKAFEGKNTVAQKKYALKGSTIAANGLAAEYEEEVQKKVALGYDVKLIQGSLALHDRLEKEKPDILALLKEVGGALEGNMRLNTITLERPKNNLAEKIENIDLLNLGAENEIKYTSVLTIIYPTTTNIDQGNRQVKELGKRLKERLPDHTVKVTKLLNDYEYTDQIIVDGGQGGADASEQDFVVEITIESKKNAQQPG